MDIYFTQNGYLFTIKIFTMRVNSRITLMKSELRVLFGVPIAECLGKEPELEMNPFKWLLSVMILITCPHLSAEGPQGGSTGGGDSDVTEFLIKAHQFQQWAFRNPQLAQIDTNGVANKLEIMERSLDPDNDNRFFTARLSFTENFITVDGEVEKQAQFDTEKGSIKVVRPTWRSMDDAHKYSLIGQEFNGLLTKNNRYAAGMVVQEHWREIAAEKVDFVEIFNRLSAKKKSVQLIILQSPLNEPGVNPRAIRMVPDGITESKSYASFSPTVHYKCSGTATYNIAGVKFNDGGNGGDSDMTLSYHKRNPYSPGAHAYMTVHGFVENPAWPGKEFRGYKDEPLLAQGILWALDWWEGRPKPTPAPKPERYYFGNVVTIMGALDSDQKLRLFYNPPHQFVNYQPQTWQALTDPGHFDIYVVGGGEQKELHCDIDVKSEPIRRSQ
jgi:hypothetical protein